MMLNGMLERTRLGTMVVLVLAGAACSDTPMAPTVDQAPRIVLDQEAVLAESHQEVITFSARVLDTSGQEVHDIPLEWETDNPEVLEALGDGAFRTLANGTASVTARVPRSHPSVAPGGYFRNVPDTEALVQVEQAARRLALFDEEEPDAPGTGSGAVTAIDIWAIDELVALAALPADEQGQTVDGFDLSGLTWASDDESVFTVDADGTITPVGDGETTIRVSGEGLSGEIMVRVRASQSIEACARLSVGGSAEASACSSLRLTFTRGG